MRAYTLDEIDRMRDVCRALVDSACVRQSIVIDDLNKEAEDQLRTYMLAGIEPHALEAKLAAEREFR